MTFNGFLRIAIYLIVLVLLTKPLGGYMARVYQGERTLLTRVLGPVERLIYRVIGVNPDQEMGWKTYTVAVLLFSVIGILFLYALQRLQGFLPLNPQGFGAVSPELLVQHRDQLRHQHQLAGLWRRDHDELSDPDAGADGTELSSRRPPAWLFWLPSFAGWCAIRPARSATSGWT